MRPPRSAFKTSAIDSCCSAAGSRSKSSSKAAWYCCGAAGTISIIAAGNSRGRMAAHRRGDRQTRREANGRPRPGWKRRLTGVPDFWRGTAGSRGRHRRGPAPRTHAGSGCIGIQKAAWPSLLIRDPAINRSPGKYQPRPLASMGRLAHRDDLDRGMPGLGCSIVPDSWSEGFFGSRRCCNSFSCRLRSRARSNAGRSPTRLRDHLHPVDSARLSGWLVLRQTARGGPEHRRAGSRHGQRRRPTV